MLPGISKSDSVESSDPKKIPFPFWKSNSVESCEPVVRPLSQKLMLTLRPLVLTLRLFGRFPFTTIVDQDRIVSYACCLKSARGVYFMVTSTILFLMLSVVTLGFIFLVKCHYRKTEPAGCNGQWETFRQYVVPFLVILTCLINSSVESIVTVATRKKFVAYLNNWMSMVEDLKMDIFDGLKRCMWREIAVFHVFVLIVVILFLIGVKPIYGGPEVVAILALSPFTSEPESGSIFRATTNIAAIVVVQSYHAYKGSVMIYMLHCRLLKRAFHEWNCRLKAAIENEKATQYEHRTSFEELYEDHIRLIVFVRETDVVFAPNLLVFYGTQVLALCLEFYFLEKSVEDDIPTFIVGIVVVFQTGLTFFLVSLTASAVHEKAQEGFEIIRKHGYLTNDSHVPKQFIESMTTSFIGHPIMLTGCKFFGINREFILKALGVALTYFIIILQFQ